jgi:SGNH hydrolase-like domain, acetyltransferase AlgX
MIRRVLVRLLPAICRRVFTGVVAAYISSSLVFGGSAAAKPTFYFLAILWGSLVLLWALKFDRGVATPRPGWTPCRFRRFEIIAFNAALALTLSEVALRASAIWWGVSPLIEDTMDAYRLAPGYVYGSGLRGNALGYPGRGFQLDKEPGRFRLAALGDSFAVGPAVPYADNYLNLLEAGLPAIEVYNFGVSGIGPREYLTILRRDVWRHRPDLVVVSIFVGNDITESMATPRHFDPRQSAAYLLLTRGWRVCRSRWARTELAADTTDQAAPTGLPAETFREIESRRLEVCLRSPTPALEKKWKSALAYLSEIAGECRRHHVPLGAVLIPDEFQVNGTVLAQAMKCRGLRRDDIDLRLPQRRLLDFFADQGVSCLDLMPAFAPESDTYAPRDTHWNVRGNHLAARRIRQWLEEEIITPMLVSGPQRPAP